MSILVVDVGTSGVRACVVRPDATVDAVHHRPVLPVTPAPGLVELDARGIAGAVLEVAGRALGDGGPVEAVGIANQRASAIVWERETGRPVGPALAWQDLRTVRTCLEMQGRGLRLAPNASATKLAAILDEVDPDRARAAAGELCFGTVDTWVAWTLSEGELHVTDPSNAGVTNLLRTDTGGWDDAVLDALRIPAEILPGIVDSSGLVGPATALAGQPTISALVGDQQASLIGQSCVRPAATKATFGTGGMLDCCLGDEVPAFDHRGPAGTFPLVAWRRDGRTTWGVEAIMLSAGSCVEWLRDDLGIVADAASTAGIAAGCEETGDVWFVPALLGLGTPVWDFGARGTLLGLTRGTDRATVVRAMLEGVAHRGVDLAEAAETDTGRRFDTLRVDGGMSANPVFVQALADALGRPVELSPVLEATSLGAGYLAGLATGAWRDEDDIAAAWRPRAVIEPGLEETRRRTLRERWLDARSRAERTIPDLSGIDF